MLTKPPQCEGCAMYGDGQGFVPDNIPDHADAVILAQNPGSDEEKGRRLVGYDGKEKLYEPCQPQPLVGQTGYDLRHKYMPLAGLNEEYTGYANILKCRWNGTNDLPTGQTYRDAVKHCTGRHLRIPKRVKLVIAMGGPAFEWTQSEKVSIHEWRGYLGVKGVNV